MTSSPTQSPTAESNQSVYFLIIFAYTIFAFFLLSCGATVYKSTNRREQFKAKQEALSKAYNQNDAAIKGLTSNLQNPDSKDDKRVKIREQITELEQMQENIRKEVDKLYSRDFYADLGDHFIAPISESGASKLMNKLLFHTSTGRVIVNLESNIEKTISGVFVYMLSLQGYAVFQFYAARSLFPQQTLLAQFFGLLIGVVLFQLLLLMKEEFVRSRMGGDMSIIEKNS